MKLNFKSEIDLTSVNDSMELNSNTTCASLTGTLRDGTKFGVHLEVQGYVSVIYKGQFYSCASDMPEELIKLFHEGGYSPEEEDLTVNENNWFELFIEEKGQMVRSDCVEAGGMDEVEVLDLLVSSYREWRDEIKQEEQEGQENHV